MSSERKQKAVAAVQEAVKQLNEAVGEAYAAGLFVELDVLGADPRAGLRRLHIMSRVFDRLG